MAILRSWRPDHMGYLRVWKQECRRTVYARVSLLALHHKPIHFLLAIETNERHEACTIRLASSTGSQCPSQYLLMKMDQRMESALKHQNAYILRQIQDHISRESAGEEKTGNQMRHHRLTLMRWKRGDPYHRVLRPHLHLLYPLCPQAPNGPEGQHRPVRPSGQCYVPFLVPPRSAPS
jgi:hypothetical protein